MHSAERHPDHHHNQSDHQWTECSGRLIALIRDCEDHQNQQRRPNGLVQKPRRQHRRKRWKCREHACGVVQPRIDRHKRWMIIPEHQRRRHKRAGHLDDTIRNHFAPRKAPVGGQRDGYGGVQVRARDFPRDVDAHRDGEPPG